MRSKGRVVHRFELVQRLETAEALLENAVAVFLSRDWPEKCGMDTFINEINEFLFDSPDTSAGYRHSESK